MTEPLLPEWGTVYLARFEPNVSMGLELWRVAHRLGPALRPLLPALPAAAARAAEADAPAPAPPPSRAARAAARGTRCFGDAGTREGLDLDDSTFD